MLTDWLDRLLLPCPAHVRALGYVRELRNIRTCHGWWGWAWANHFQRTREVIRAACARCRQRRKALLFGSGWLHDIPLDELADSFREVVLVDLVHPLRTRWRVRRCKNVRLVSADVTATIEEVHRVARLPGVPLPRSLPQLFRDETDIDLTASVNLLSQLPDLPAKFLRQAGVHPPEQIDAYARDVIQAHLEFLRGFAGVVSLIADFEERVVSRSGKTVESQSTIYGMELPWQGERWTWRLVPHLRRDPTLSKRLEVVGIADIHESERVSTSSR